MHWTKLARTLTRLGSHAEYVIGVIARLIMLAMRITEMRKGDTQRQQILQYACGLKPIIYCMSSSNLLRGKEQDVRAALKKNHKYNTKTSNHGSSTEFCKVLLPFNCVDVTDTNKFKQANEQQRQCSTVVVKHLEPVLSRMLGKQ